MLATPAALLLVLAAQAPAPSASPAPDPAAAGALPEMIVLPPKPEEGIKNDVAMQIYKAAVAEADKAKTGLGMSTRLQTEAKTALAGPAREQGWECKGEIPCLAELGSTLGASFVIAGSVSKSSVSFLVVDVKKVEKTVGVRSHRKLDKAGWQRQSKAAIKGVLEQFDKKLKAPPAAPEPPPVVALDPNVAEVRIAPGELTDVRELSFDGLPLPFTIDAGVAWSGVPGRHVVVATRQDGTRAVHELTLEGGTSLPLVLVFVEPPLAPAAGTPPPARVVSDDPPRDDGALVARAPPPASEDDDGATSKWWFWVGLGAAVAAGGATAAVLAGGIKGGVATDSGRGTITGEY